MTAAKVKSPIPTAIRNRKRIIWTLRALFAALIASSLIDIANSPGDDWSTYDHHQFTCIAALDAQTITVQQNPSTPPTPVHLLGIAGCTPHWDAQAQHQLARYINQKLTLKLDPTQTRDAAGRLLAYAFPDDQTTINAELVRQGLALAYRPQPSLLLSTIEQAEREARTKRRGLWSFVDPWEMPAWRRDWTQQERARREKLQSAMD
ncbi:MAG: thermonuclease family protein [Tepidisphaeraceae bacterium]|jgi:endonuclease YncB( thermonuclease family)